MKPLKLLFFFLLLAAGTAFGQSTITWTAATNPHIVSGTYTVPVGTTLVLEAGVIVQIQSNSTLLVQGTMNSNGTATNRVSITGADNFSAKLDAKGTLNVAFTDLKAQVVPDDNGVLLFSDCIFTGYGTVFNGTVLQGSNTRAPYVHWFGAILSGTEHLPAPAFTWLMPRRFCAT